MRLAGHNAAVRKRTASDRVVRRVLTLMQGGRLSPGDQLPPENEFVRRLKLSRPSVREGLRELATLGLVESRHGQGTFVREFGSDVVIRRELMPILLMSEALHEVQDTRRLLEGEIAARAAARATPEDLRRLDDLLDRSADASAHRNDIYRLAWRFHNELALLSGNRVMARVLAILQDLMGEAQIKLYNPHVSPTDEVRGHRVLLEAIREGNPEHARRVMMGHLNEVDQVVARTVAKARATASAPRGSARGAAPGRKALPQRRARPSE